MPVVGIDDTDSRDRGMCTTFVAARIAGRLREAGFDVHRHLLVRCNPAVEHKTRGNAALALHVDDGSPVPDAARVTDGGSGGAALESPDDPVERCVEIARETIEALAATVDGDANPGLVVADGTPDDVPDDVAAFATDAVRDHHRIEDAVAIADRHGYRHVGWGNGRGRIGALAAVGAWRANDEWTYERIAYRERDRWGTERDVDVDSVFEAVEGRRPAVWDTVDRESGTAVCVPRTPCPVLFGIRGDDRTAVEAVADAIECESVERAVTFVTNQGTDAHLHKGAGAHHREGTEVHLREGTNLDRDGAPDAVEDGCAYRIDGTVATNPETREGGHVFFGVDTGAEATSDGRSRQGSDVETGSGGVGRLPCVAFEPTKRFRDRVRALRPGDSVTVCGEVADGTLKLEKFAVRELVRTEETTPTCPDCDSRMESAGADQGYRCRDCGTDAPGPVERTLDRDLEPGWYEVPPIARRHVAKPLVRGGFDAPVHPEE